METALDVNVLQRATGDDPALVCEIVRDFVSYAESGLAQIHTAVAGEDAKLVGATIHRLRGSARLVGAYAFSDTLARVEAAAEATDWTMAQQLMPHLSGLMQHIRASAAAVVDAQPTIWK